MRRKYFLRGLGVGIVITALIFTIALFFENPTLSPSEIIEKAEALGMVMPDNTLDGTRPEGNKNENNQAGAEGAEGNEGLEGAGDSGETEGSENGDGAGEAGDNPDGSGNVVEPFDPLNPGGTGPEISVEIITGTDVTPAPTPGDNNNGGSNSGGTTVGSTVSSENIVTFTVRSGESSYTVGRNLERAGLVDSASSFDTYLEQNGYDMAIQVGTFEIRKGSNYETIAKIITRR